MELKPIRLHTGKSMGRSLNCTVMELKPLGVNACTMSMTSLNCTVMELKHCNDEFITFWFCVLIVPLWN